MKFAASSNTPTSPSALQSSGPRIAPICRSCCNQGRLIVAGPFTDGIGALFVYDASSEDEASRLAANDPFAKASLFKAIVMKPWTLVFSSQDHLAPAL